MDMFSKKMTKVVQRLGFLPLVICERNSPQPPFAVRLSCTSLLAHRPFATFFQQKKNKKKLLLQPPYKQNPGCAFARV